MTPQAAVDSTERLDGEATLDDDELDAVLESLFRYEPPPHVIAAGENGLTVPMPAAVPVLSGNVVNGVKTALALCLPADLPIMMEAWQRVRRMRGAQAALHLSSTPDRMTRLYFVDARYRYGVYLGFFAGNTGKITANPGEIDDTNAGPSLFRPRLCTLQQSDDAVIRAIDAAVTQILGWSNAEVIGRRSLDFIHPDDHQQAIAKWMEMLGRPDADQRGLLRFRHCDGSYIWFESTHRNRLADPAIGRVLTDLVDVSERMDAVAALRANEQLLRRLTEALPVGILQVDAERRIVHANERLGEIVGVSGAATFDEQFALVPPADRKAFENALSGLAASAASAEIELTVDHPDGPRRCSVSLRALTADDGAVTGAIACVSDITERSRMRLELEKRATFDTLTRCRNRAAILETLAWMLHAENRPGTGIAVLFVDLDHFKAINDRLGHAAGDELLRRVGARLLHAARAADIVGRLGGDEFLIVCPDVAAPQSALDIARRIALSLAQGTVIGSESIVPASSIGVAWTDVAVDADTLVARADAAMYQSKRWGNGPVLSQAPTCIPARTIAGVTAPPCECRVMAGADRPDVLRLMGEFRRDEQRLRDALALFVERRVLGFVWLAYRENALAGCCSVGYTIAPAAGGIVAIVRDLYVRADVRRCGVASALLDTLDARLRAAGVAASEICTSGVPELEAFLAAYGLAPSAGRIFTADR